MSPLTTLEDYRSEVDESVITDIYRLARPLYGKSMIHLNSTYQGGGVAEILSSLVPLMNDVGISAGWRILHGSPDFFNITKKFHNALQGEDLNFTGIKKEVYTNINEQFSQYTHIHHDAVIVHDPQPLPLIKYFKKRQPWIWRCHVDLSNPHPVLWDFLVNFLLRYDTIIFSSEKYRKEDLSVDYKIFQPAIDPLSVKNKPLSKEDKDFYLEKFKIPTDKPIITQISRFDKWKDPEGVIKVYNKVKKSIDCRLILCGSMASDDPEGWDFYRKIREEYHDQVIKGDIIFITDQNDFLVNLLQRVSDVIIQKSVKEGFGLTVTEALWKERPVVASKVGGIPLQITDGKDGYLLPADNFDQFAEKIQFLLENPSEGKKIGKEGKKTVREKFLITRLLKDYLELLLELTNK
ncbi:MAG: glycosyltransferase [Candidatus Thorarchaeota archaeon]